VNRLAVLRSATAVHELDVSDQRNGQIDEEARRF
jgi:hypothetical protein